MLSKMAMHLDETLLRELPTTFWSYLHWILAILLAMAVGVTKIAKTRSLGTPLNIWLYINKFMSSVIGGSAVVFLCLGFSVNTNLTYFAAMLGAYLGTTVFEIGEDELRKKLGIERRVNNDD